MDTYRQARDWVNVQRLRLHLWEQRQIERLHDEDDVAVETFNHALEEFPHWVGIITSAFGGGGHH